MKLRKLTDGHRFQSVSYLAAILAVLVLVNVIINALATRFSWYLYTEERYEHEIGGASDVVFSDVSEEESVRVLFCMPKEELLGDTIYSLVLNTFLQLAERHSFISIEYVNIYLHPSAVRDYTTRTTASGETLTYAINEQSVILVSGEDFRVESLESFFILDEDRVITAYNGEEIAIAAISWVLADSHPLVGFTHNHGENFTNMAAFSTTLLAAGYDITLLDLSEEIPEGVELIVIANPRWDFDRGAGGLVAELDRLAAFADGGGTLFVSLDPYAKGSLVGLRSFLEARGLAATQDVIHDAENSLTYDGYTLVTDAAPSAYATEIFARSGAFSSAHAIVSHASVITCLTAKGWTVEPILLSSPTAKTYKNGTLTDEAGSYPVLAVSHRTEGGVTSSIFLTSSVYLLANDVLNSATYQNRAVLLASLERAVGKPMPVGCTILAIGNERLEDLTMGTARLYAALLVGVLPLAVVGTGILITVRRKIR